MAYEQPNFKPTGIVAAADLRTKQFLAMKITAAKTVNVSGAGEFSYGLLRNTPNTGEAAELIRSGLSFAVAGAAFAAGAKLMSDAAGKLVTATSGNHPVAQAVEAATGANQIVTVDVLPSMIPLA